jgi:predicted PurR-regulated permease PerM|tara:strand:- start:1470 stop:2486 length:1017 start_codon:yes stop_codon:yes gene_type:complete
MADDSIVKRGLVGAIIIGIFILAFFILKPIIIPIIFGILFAYIFNPIYKWLYSLMRRKNLAATILIMGIIFIITLPLVYFAPIIVREAVDTLILLQNFNLTSLLSEYMNSEVAQGFSVNLENIFSQITVVFINQFKIILINLPSFILKFAVFLFTFFFVIRDSDEIKKYVSSLSPFSKITEVKFLRELRGITNAIVFGQILVGLLQGIAVGAALFILGVPKAIILTILASLLSIIPILGSWLVWAPVSLYLLSIGQIFQGFFLLIYGAFFISSIDNIIRPYILSRQSNLPIALSIIGTIGGLYFFGIAGLILGPLILAYVLIIIEFYREGRLNDLFKR